MTRPFYHIDMLCSEPIRCSCLWMFTAIFLVVDSSFSYRNIYQKTSQRLCSSQKRASPSHDAATTMLCNGNSMFKALLFTTSSVLDVGLKVVTNVKRDFFDLLIARFMQWGSWLLFRLKVSSCWFLLVHCEKSKSWNIALEPFTVSITGTEGTF